MKNKFTNGRIKYYKMYTVFIITEKSINEDKSLNIFLIYKKNICTLQAVLF